MGKKVWYFKGFVFKNIEKSHEIWLLMSLKPQKLHVLMPFAMTLISISCFRPFQLVSKALQRTALLKIDDSQRQTPSRGILLVLTSGAGHWSGRCASYWNAFLLPSATKLRRLCFYRHLSVHTGGCLSQCMLGYHTHTPPEQTPPEQTPPQSRHPPERRPLLRTVRILLECILVYRNKIAFNLKCAQFIFAEWT